jgi:hypothetical protein
MEIVWGKFRGKNSASLQIIQFDWANHTYLGNTPADENRHKAALSQPNKCLPPCRLTANSNKKHWKI